MKSHFQFDLPKELLAEFPSEHRDEARLMVIDRKKQTIEHKTFKDVIDYFDDGDVLILNNTKVFPHVCTEIKKNRSKNRSFT
jgi:S-adenosylmethionine:tRNA ribosyltransferase-isomerase